jgi:hypothetical protein
LAVESTTASLASGFALPGPLVPLESEAIDARPRETTAASPSLLIDDLLPMGDADALDEIIVPSEAAELAIEDSTDRAVPTAIVKSQLEREPAADAAATSLLADPQSIAGAVEEPSPPNLPEPAHEVSTAELAAHRDLKDPQLKEQFAQLAARLMSDLGPTTTKTVVLIGAEHQPHVMDVALRTAMALCRPTNKRVLLMDGALGDRHLTAGLGLAAEAGLAEVLKGRVSWQQAIRPTATPGLCVLPAGRLQPPSLLGEDSRLTSLCKELSTRWDLVLIDGGCVADTAAESVMTAGRNVYLVVRLGETQTAAAAQACKTIGQAGAKLRGSIVTNAA